MFCLVLGGSKAGKSRYAEKLSVALHGGEGRLIYVATMIPVGEGEAGSACVGRHRRQREGYGFDTVEQPLGFAGLDVSRQDTVLLEDVSNLVANHLFSPGGGRHYREAMNDIEFLLERSGHVVAVSFYDIQPSDDYDDATNDYIRQLAAANEELIQRADRVIMLERGVPAPRKGPLPL